MFGKEEKSVEFGVWSVEFKASQSSRERANKIGIRFSGDMCVRKTP